MATNEQWHGKCIYTIKFFERRSVMMDLSILVFFQRWLIENKKEQNNHGMSDSRTEGTLNGHPPLNAGR